jgi:hypothetical protein
MGRKLILWSFSLKYENSFILLIRINKILFLQKNNVEYSANIYHFVRITNHNYIAL